MPLISALFVDFSSSLVQTVGKISTVETRIKEPIFIRTLRLTFNILDPLNKNLSEADIGGGSCITGFMTSEFLRTFKKV